MDNGSLAHETDAPDAPAVRNAIAILSELRSHAPRALGVSELSRALTLNKASVFRILQTLAAGSFVVQDPLDKTYVLGPALIPLGQAVAGDTRLLDAAHATLPRVAGSSGFSAHAWRLLPDARLALVAEALADRPASLHFSSGHTYPLTPPMGLVFLAWSSAAEIDQWLARSESGGFGPHHWGRDRLLVELERTRDRGYAWGAAVTRPTEDGLAQLERWLQRAGACGLHSGSAVDRVDHMNEVRRWAQHQNPNSADSTRIPVPIIGIAAPAFDHEGRVALNVSIAGFAGEIDPERVSDLARFVRDGASAVTAAIGGRPPAVVRAR